MELREARREAHRKDAKDLVTGKREAVSGQPQKVRRKLLVWDDDLDFRIVTADAEELALVALDLGVSPERILRRRQAVIYEAQKGLMQ